MAGQQHPVLMSELLRDSKDKQVSFRWAMALDQRLDALVRRAEDAGERTTRREILAALIAHADYSGEELGGLLRALRPRSCRRRRARCRRSGQRGEPTVVSPRTPLTGGKGVTTGVPVAPLWSPHTCGGLCTGPALSLRRGKLRALAWKAPRGRWLRPRRLKASRIC